MDYGIANELAEEAVAHGIDFKLLSYDDSLEFVIRMMALFASSGSYRSGFDLCSQLNDHTHFFDPDGWQYLDRIASDSPVRLVFEDPAVRVLEVESPIGVVELIRNSVGFEFVLSNRDVDFAVGFNHHDCLMICGDIGNGLSRVNNPAARKQ